MALVRYVKIPPCLMFQKEQKSRMENKTLYERLAGYDNIAAVANDLLPLLMSDPLLGRFWQNRGEDGIRREKQLLIDFLCANSGGPLAYVGRDMLTTHKGMGINRRDWDNFTAHLKATFEHFQVSEKEKSEVFGFIESLKGDIVEK
jgi:hemoglobin